MIETEDCSKCRVELEKELGSKISRKGTIVTIGLLLTGCAILFGMITTANGRLYTKQQEILTDVVLLGKSNQDSINNVRIDMENHHIRIKNNEEKFKTAIDKMQVQNEIILTELRKINKE